MFPKDHQERLCCGSRKRSCAEEIPRDRANGVAIPLPASLIPKHLQVAGDSLLSAMVRSKGGRSRSRASRSTVRTSSRSPRHAPLPEPRPHPVLRNGQRSTKSARHRRSSSPPAERQNWALRFSLAKPEALLLYPSWYATVISISKSAVRNLCASRFSAASSRDDRWLPLRRETIAC